MNGAQAKALRRLAFKHSQGKPSGYEVIKHTKNFWDADKKKWRKLVRYQLRCTGYRAIYQALKKAFYRGRRSRN